MANSLTLTEKQHWKDRIAKRIDRRIDALCAEQPGFMEQVQKTAHEQAYESLGISQLQKRLERLDRQESLLEQKRTKTLREILSKLRGVSLRQVKDDSRYQAEREISEAIEKRQPVLENGLLVETPRGREIVSLRLEKENLLDTVWLASSPKQIKDLWQRVDDMLGGDQTALQKEALAIDPIDPS